MSTTGSFTDVSSIASGVSSKTSVTSQTNSEEDDDLPFDKQGKKKQKVKYSLIDLLQLPNKDILRDKRVAIKYKDAFKELADKLWFPRTKGEYHCKCLKEEKPLLPPNMGWNWKELPKSFVKGNKNQTYYPGQIKYMDYRDGKNRGRRKLDKNSSDSMLSSTSDSDSDTDIQEDKLKNEIVTQEPKRTSTITPSVKTNTVDALKNKPKQPLIAKPRTKRKVQNRSNDTVSSDEEIMKRWNNRTNRKQLGPRNSEGVMEMTGGFNKGFDIVMQNDKAPIKMVIRGENKPNKRNDGKDVKITIGRKKSEI